MRNSFYRRTFALLTFVVLAAALIAILKPFWDPFAWAGVLAFLLHPLHVRLTRRLSGGAGVSAGILTGLTPFVVIAPLAALGLAFVQQAGALTRFLQTREITSYSALVDELEQRPVIGRLLQWVSSEASVTAEQVETWLVASLQTLLKGVAAATGNVALGVAGTLVGFFLMLFLLFFLLRDGESMLRQAFRLIPLESGRRAHLQHHLVDVTHAVLYGTAMTALLQGALVGVGFAIARLPSPIVFGMLGVVAAFIPVGGTALVLVPGAVYLALNGRWGAAAFLAVWAVLVGLSDNFLRPFLTAQRAPVPTLAVFVGAIGGAAAFGFIGLIVGPVILSLIVALIRFALQSTPD